MNYKNIEGGSALANFKSKFNTNIFSHVQGALPPFLNENLLDPQRIIKHFQNDPQAPIRIFYYQYLKLCFQMQLSDYQSYIVKLEQIIESESFSFNFPCEKDKNIFNNDLAKRLMVQFMQYLDKQQITVQYGLNQFPIMDEIFICFIRTLLIQNNICEEYDQTIPREKLFEFLASYFCLDIALYENCLKFIDSDVFMYEKDPENIYMIFIDYEKQKEYQVIHQQTDSDASSIQQPVSKHNIQQDKNQEYEKEKQSQKNSGIFEFVDYTNIKIQQKQQAPQMQVYQQYYKQQKSSINGSSIYSPNNVIWQVPQPFEEHLSTIPKFTPHNTYTENYLGTSFIKLKQLEHSLQNLKTRQNSENLFYGRGIQAISQYASIPSNTFTLENRTFGRTISENQQKFDSSIDSKGKLNPFKNPRKVSSFVESINGQYQYNYLKNLSNEFTDSLLLKQIKEPFHTNIRMMKTRARAQRTALFHS